MKKTPVAHTAGSPLSAAEAKYPSPAAGHGPLRDGFATVLEYVLLIAVGSLLAVVALLMIEQGVVNLVKRIGEVLVRGL